MRRVNWEKLADRCAVVGLALCMAICVALLIAVVLLAIGVIPSGEPDPCRYGGTGKTSPHYLHGWQTYGGRKVWCGK